MENILKDISILTVHYNTPSLLIDLLQSVNEFYPTVNVFVVDGSDKNEIIKEVKEICSHKNNCRLFTIGKNIHHGPGLDYGIHKIKSQYILLLDTDSKLIKGGILEQMLIDLKDGYGIGTIEYVNRDGWNVPDQNGIPYLHPRCSLISKKEYLIYKPACKHGAPMITAMTDIFDKGDSFKLVHFAQMDEYYFHIGRGTVTLTGGYHLEKKKSLLNKLFKRIYRKITRSVHSD